MASNDVLRVRQSSKSGSETCLDSEAVEVTACEPFESLTIRSGSEYGSGSSSTALTTLNTVVLAPTPRASVRIAPAAKPGVRASERIA
jgi:hypothetical protein